ncbi:hypothetical protein KRMM14A1004_58870 [Krasilnikovia sp. MM14-A1004]
MISMSLGLGSLAIYSGAPRRFTRQGEPTLHLALPPVPILAVLGGMGCTASVAPAARAVPVVGAVLAATAMLAVPGEELLLILGVGSTTVGAPAPVVAVRRERSMSRCGRGATGGTVGAGRVLPHELFDSGGCGFRVLVLPHPDHCPARLAEPAIGIAIPGHVRRELFGPPFTVRSGACPMFGASVPETSIEEYGYLGGDESEINFSPCTGYEWGLETIAESATIEVSSNPQLQAGVGRSLLFHPQRDVG